MMKTFAIAVVTVAAGAAMAAPAVASEPGASSLDFMGRSVDFEAAAEAETLTTPTTGFTVSARFGDAGGSWSSGHHTGLDFAGPVGTPIVAADDGKVIEAGPGGAYGNMVVIAHGDGTRTLYAHLTSISVTKGQQVDRGQRIGRLGSTGNSSGPHLHFEVLQRGTQVNPEHFLDL